MLSITLLVPAQELMLWCDMMDMNMVESHEAMSMQMDNMHSQDTEHCDTQDFGASDTSPDKDCDLRIDCNCVSLQSSNIEYGVLNSSTVSLQIPIAISFLDLSGFQYSFKVIPPPPLWSFSSYSPPDLFLANGSLLI